jgi:hypothetical protein
MLCPTCHGRHIVNVAGTIRPCPECGGMGEVHCCDGMQAQPGISDSGCRIGPATPTPAAAPRADLRS